MNLFSDNFIRQTLFFIPTLHQKWKVGRNREVEKKIIFPNSTEILKALSLSPDVNQWCSCSFNSVLIFKVNFCMSTPTWLNSGSLKRPLLSLHFYEKFTSLILKFHFLLFNLLSPWLLWMIAFLSGAICIKLLTITWIFIVLKCAQVYSTYFTFTPFNFPTSLL